MQPADGSPTGGAALRPGPRPRCPGRSPARASVLHAQACPQKAACEKGFIGHAATCLLCMKICKVSPPSARPCTKSEADPPRGAELRQKHVNAEWRRAQLSLRLPSCRCASDTRGRLCNESARVLRSQRSLVCLPKEAAALRWPPSSQSPHNGKASDSSIVPRCQVVSCSHPARPAG